MRKFWGYYDNGIYRIGCNGNTVYVFDQNNEELTKFKDIRYAYTGAFMPDKNVFAIKSTEGSLAFYDLDNLSLIKKIVITRIGAQDEGFAFSPDGKFFYNIEKPVSSCRTQLSIYDTTDFSKVRTLFADREDMHLTILEFNAQTEICYILGFMRKSDGVFDYGFIGVWQEEKEMISQIKQLTYEQYEYFGAYKHWELAGFTDKTFMNRSVLYRMKNIIPISL